MLVPEKLDKQQQTSTEPEQISSLIFRLVESLSTFTAPFGQQYARYLLTLSLTLLQKIWLHLHPQSLHQEFENRKRGPSIGFQAGGRA